MVSSYRVCDRSVLGDGDYSDLGLMDQYPDQVLLSNIVIKTTITNIFKIKLLAARCFASL